MKTRTTAHFARTILLLASLAGFANTQVLAQLPKIGGEILLNTSSPASESQAAVAMDAIGNYVVAYTNLDSANAGVELRRYNRDGTPNGGYFKPYTTDTGVQAEPSVSMANDGRFVVVWEDSAARGGNNYDVFFSLYDAAGALVTGPTRVNTIATGVRENPRVSMNRETGEFVVVWAGGASQAAVNVYMRRYNASGVALDAADVSVNSVTNGNTSAPGVAFASNGNFIVAWEGNADASLDWEATFQRYAFNVGGNATPLGSNTIANAAGHDTTNVNVACDDDGNFVLIWVDGLPSGPTDPKDLLFRRYAANGTPATPITVYKTGAYPGNGDSQTAFARVAMQSNTNFFITYMHNDEIYAKFFDKDGALLGSEIHVNTTSHSGTGEFQSKPSVAINPSGTRAIVVWHGTGAVDLNGAHAQRFAAPNNPPTLSPIGNKTVEALQSLEFTVSADPNDLGDSIVYSLEGGTIPAGATINATTGEFSWTPTVAQAPGDYPITIRATDDGEPPAFDEETITVSVTEIPETVPPVSQASIADATIAGTGSINVDFIATDDDSGVDETALYVRVPFADTFADSGLPAQTGTSGTFAYTATEDGVYEFYTISIDNNGNIEPTPASADTSATVNLVENSELSLPVTSATQALVFPMTMDLDTTITLSDAQVGTTLTVSRNVAPVLPDYFTRPEYILKESLSIDYNGATGYTAGLQWAFDPANLVDPAEVTEVYRFDGTNGPLETIPATVQDDVINVDGITSFSDWYAGTKPASIDSWMLY